MWVVCARGGLVVGHICTVVVARAGGWVTSLVTRVAYGRLKNGQAQRANQASDSSLPISMVYSDGLRVIPLQRITWGRIGTNPCLCLL